MHEITVANRHHHKGQHVGEYVGRGTPLGNPYGVKPLVLVCSCAPRPCHADVIRRILLDPPAR
jgi:hypothetical protein